MEVGGEKGYHMVRGSMGVSEGSWYFEVEIVNGGGEMTVSNDNPTRVGLDVNRSGPVPGASAGGASIPDDPHVRVGFAMRSGDRQAPVGFDKWSYGYRDSSGSKIHKSIRVDDWGGDAYKAGDIVGFGITLNDNEKVSKASGERRVASEVIRKNLQKHPKCCFGDKVPHFSSHPPSPKTGDPFLQERGASGKEDWYERLCDGGGLPARGG